MKLNTNQQKQKRSQFINPQKTSFVSISPKNDINLKTVPNKYGLTRHQTYDNFDSNKLTKAKNTDDQGFTNIFADDSQSTKQFSRRDNYMSTQNLRVSVKGLLNQGKNVRQSEDVNANNHIRTPPNSLVDKKVISTAKSAVNLIKPNEEFLYIKSDTLIQDNQQEETQQNKQLQTKIKQAEAFNQKIKQQNIQLRLKKLSSNSEPLQMLTLKLQIQQLKRKIQKLRNQNAKIQQPYNQYYTVKKNNPLNKQFIPITTYPQKPKNNQLPRSASNLQYQNPYYMSTPYPHQYQPQLQAQSTYQNSGFSPTNVIKFKAEQKQRQKIRKMNTIPSEMNINSYQNFNNTQKIQQEYNRIYIRK